MPQRTVLVTGANGFVGAALCGRLAADGHAVVGTTRRPFGRLPPGARRAWVPNIDGATDWTGHLDGVDAVVHLAAPAHVTGRLTQATAEIFRRAIVDGTERLARAARAAGVRRFVFISTVKVHGERTERRAFVEDDPHHPGDLYAQSKSEAERLLRRIAAETGLEVTILRPPLVYGAGVKGNLNSLIRLCDAPWPLPFASAENRRSLIHVGNLVDVVALCVEAPAAAGATWLLRDGRDYSTRELASGVRALLGRPARLFPLPRAATWLASLLPFVSSRASRLFASLVVDDSRIRRDLGWRPPFSLASGLAEMVAAHAERRDRPHASGVVFDARPAEDGVSVVMVSYNNAELMPVLEAARQDAAIGEIIVVDNGNDPPILEAVRALQAVEPRLSLITGHGNVGFATGCNIGAAVAKRRHLLLLNPDCYLKPDTIGRLSRQFEDAPAGPWVAGVRLTNEDGSEQRGTRRNVGTPMQWLVEALRFDRVTLPLARIDRVNLHQAPVPAAVTGVPAISGAFMFMPRATYESVGGMDPRYFLHFEDLDFCMKVHEAGGRVLFCPDIVLMHKKSQSRASPLFVERQKCRSMRIYFRKHFARGHAPAIHLIWLVLSAALLTRGWLRLMRDKLLGSPPEAA
ncbi:MAG: NAD-dependent epimerase/dehydratase family protein [Alphaproteobacteria bacterium]|nr:NAD-dependent epimerase/dehydratase family protein [Alphaproteobacteria bacterium]